MRVRKGIFPVGGLGTGFLPATKAMPKEMLPIVDKPAIQSAVEEAVAAEIRDVVIVTGRGKRAIEDHFDHSFELESILSSRGQERELAVVRHVASLCRIVYSRQKQPLGLGHAILGAQHLVEDESFAVFLADDVIVSRVPAIRQLIEVHEETGATVLAVERVPPERTSSYGVIRPGASRGSVHVVEDLVEKPFPSRSPSNLAVVGRYVLTPKIFPLLERTAPGARGEIQLTDAIRNLAKSEQVLAVELEATRYDAGSPLGYMQAAITSALAREDIGPELHRWLEERLAQAREKAAKSASGEDESLG